MGMLEGALHNFNPEKKHNIQLVLNKPITPQCTLAIKNYYFLNKS